MKNRQQMWQDKCVFLRSVLAIAWSTEHAGLANAVPKHDLIRSTHTMDLPSAPFPTKTCINSGCLCRDTAKDACANRIGSPSVLANAEISKAPRRCRS